jgi:protein-S-isoprenylcysteine O-methyltransferase Ste14
MFFASLGFIALLVVPALDHRMHWSHVPPFIVMLGDVLVAVGWLIVLIVLRENSFASATIEVSDNQRVISTGPYAVVRHPMYAGSLLLCFGMPLALGSYWGLLAFAAMTPFLILRLFDEERFLMKNLPRYAEYCAKVHWRLIPRVF